MDLKSKKEAAVMNNYFKVMLASSAIVIGLSSNISIARQRQENFTVPQCKYGTAIKTSEDFVRECVIVENATLALHSTDGGGYASRVVGCERGSYVRFHDHGGVAQCRLAYDVTIRGAKGVMGCEAGSTLHVDETGIGRC